MSQPTLELVRGKTHYLRGKVYEGRASRDLIGFGDQIRFAIAIPTTMQRVVTKLSTAGEIVLTEDGDYRIKLDPDNTSPSTLPLTRYRYEIELVNGSTSDQELLEHGDLIIEDSPFPTSDTELM